MSSDLWFIKSHQIRASHIRGFPRGVRNEETARLRLSVKQYIPKVNENAQSGDITLLFSPGVGLGKETNEPFFDDLLRIYSRVRGIWAVDFAWSADSYMLNKDVIGDEPSWIDVARDLLHVVNTFQDDMIPPIYGMGYSFGCSVLTLTSAMHPRLFSGLILVEPIYGTGFRPGHHKHHRAVWMAKRKEQWDSQTSAREELLKMPFYAGFEKRVFEKVLKYNLRSDPRDSEPHGVVLKTPKSMEVYTMMRRDATLPGYASWPEGQIPREVTIIPGFYRPDNAPNMDTIPKLLPQILLIWGQYSDLPQIPGYVDWLRNAMGTAPGASGGEKAGAISSVVVESCKHTVPYEQPTALAKKILPWLQGQEEQWALRKAQSSEEQQDFYVNQLPLHWLERINKL